MGSDQYAALAGAWSVEEGRVEVSIIVRSDQDLVTAHQAGDREAFAELVSVHRDGLMAHAQRRLHDPEASRDAVQETFLRAYRAMGRFGGERLVRPWLHRILDNVCNDEGARRQREAFLIQRVSARRPDVAEASEVIDASVESALAALPPTYREVLLLRAIDDLSFRDLAARTGVSEANARVRFHRARNLFTRVFEGAGAILLPLPVAGSRFLRRFHGPGGSPGAVASRADAPSSLATMLSSPTAVHLLTEVSATSERAGGAAKVLLAIVATVPMFAAEVHSSDASRSQSAAHAAVATVALSSSAPDSDLVVSQSVGEAGTHAGPTEAVTVPVAPEDTPPTSELIVAPEAASVTRAGSGTADVPVPLPPTAPDGPPSGSTVPAGGGTSDEGAAAPGNQSGRMQGQLRSEHAHDATTYRGAVTLTVGTRSLQGWLGCRSEQSPDGATASVRCAFVSDDQLVTLTIVAARTTTHTDGSGNPVGTYEGSYSISTPDSDGMSTTGSAFLRIAVDGDAVSADAWFDPPAG